MQAAWAIPGRASERPRPGGARSAACALVAAVMACTAIVALEGALEPAVHVSAVSIPAQSLAAGPVRAGRAGGRISLASAPLALRWATASLLAPHPRRYDAVPGATGLTAAGGGLSTTFSARGPVVRAHGASLGLTLVGIGARAVGRTAPQAAGTRVLYRWPGVLEWYRNGPLGLEQGFTLARPAGAEGPTTRIAMRLGGQLQARLFGGQLELSSRSGQRPVMLRYGGLSATDAHGRVLASRIELRGRTVVLAVRTRGASFPVRIDPFVQSGNKIAVGINTRGIVPSVSLSSDGTRALLGIPDRFTGGLSSAATGEAFIMQRSDNGWSQTAALIPSGKFTQADVPGFGSSVALSGNGGVAVIGGPKDSGNTGAVWIFVLHSNKQWAQQGPKRTVTGETGAGQLGSSVAVSADGGTFVATAPQDNSAAGAAWVFTRTAGVWAQQGGAITPVGQTGAAQFGNSVALTADGNTALVGADQNASGAGAAWVFTRSGSTWTQGPELTSVSHGGSPGNFGASVSLSADGSRALIGEPCYGRGAAWVLSNSGSSWSRTAELVIDNSTPCLFGSAVALSGDGTVAMVGTPRYNGSDGAMWAFHNLNGNSWQQMGPPSAPGNNISTGAQFGAEVTLSSDGTRSLVTAPADDLGQGSKASVWEFDASGSPCVYPDQVELPDGLLGYWRLGESSGTVAHDELRANNATYGGGVTLGLREPGAILGSANTSAGLDGSTGEVSLPSLGTSSDWTIEGWTNLDQSASSNPSGNNALYAGGGGVRLLIRPAGFAVDDYTTGTQGGQIHGSTRTNIGVWTFWVVVRNGATLTVYRNGQAVATAADGEPGPSNLNGSIGAYGSIYHLHGRVDEVAVYGAALDHAAVQGEYQCSGWG
jgi:Concanavalin A-like lectin/glucanases superfamily